MTRLSCCHKKQAVVTAERCASQNEWKWQLPSAAVGEPRDDADTTVLFATYSLQSLFDLPSRQQDEALDEVDGMYMSLQCSPDKPVLWHAVVCNGTIKMSQA